MRSNQDKEISYGLYVPNFGKASSPAMYAELALEAERQGWDGFFLWDHLVEWDKRIPLFDSFTLLAAIAMNTRHIRIGTTVSPLPRFKPWIVARQTTSLDHLSNGRMILGVGLGGEETTDYERFGEVADTRILAEKLDESLEVIAGLWSGREFGFNGKHYRVGNTVFLPPPIQKPRIPVWVGGFWPRKGPFLRAAKWDGVIPLALPERLARPSELKEICAFIRKHRGNLTDYDVVEINWTTGMNLERNAEKVSQYVSAGATWWLESLYTMRDSPERMLKRILAGPPRIR